MAEIDENCCADMGQTIMESGETDDLPAALWRWRFMPVLPPADAPPNWRGRLVSSEGCR